MQFVSKEAKILGEMWLGRNCKEMWENIAVHVIEIELEVDLVI